MYDANDHMRVLIVLQEVSGQANSCQSGPLNYLELLVTKNSQTGSDAHLLQIHCHSMCTFCYNVVHKILLVSQAALAADATGDAYAGHI